MTDNPELTQALTQLLLAVMTLATVAITTVAIPWLRTQVGADRLRTAATLAETVVKAVEQTMPDGGAAGKFLSAKAQLLTLARSRGVNLSDDEVEALIESAVHNLRLLWQAVDAPPLTPLDAAVAPRRRLPARGPDGRFLPREGA